MTEDLFASILAQKIFHKGLLYKGIQSKITLPLGKDKLFAIRITSKDDKFILVELVTSGIQNPMKFEVYNRPKVTVVKEVKSKEVKEDDDKSVEQETLF